MKHLYDLLKQEEGPRTHITIRLSSVPGQLELTMIANDGAYASMQLIVDEIDSPAYIKSIATWIRLSLKHLRETKG